MSIIFSNEQDTLIAKIRGDIDHHNARQIREEIDAKFLKAKPKTIIIDFKDLDFMDSSGIGLILGRYKLASSLDAQLKVINVPRYFLKVIRISGLEQLGILEQNGKLRR